ncbi:C-type lectin domain 4 member E [Bulinus truncatus]|nr:C-type lectin domain 4 member E [Bulinus truncatus]
MKDHYEEPVDGSSYRGAVLYKVDNPFTTLWSSNAIMKTYYHTESVTECARRCLEEDPTCGAIAFGPDDRTCTLGECYIQQPVTISESIDRFQTQIQELCSSTPGFSMETNGHTSACLWWSDTTLNFTDAMIDCKAKRFILATFKTWEKFQILAQKPIEIYIGLDDMEVEGVYRWHDDGSVLDMTYREQIFMAEEPNNLNNNEDCIAYDDVTGLNDISCSTEYRYVCEKICVDF